MSGHCDRLKNMYFNAPVQQLYPGISLDLETGKAVISLPVRPQYFHAGNAVHGSVYFRLLDDSAYFSVNSLVPDVFMLTTSFHIDLLRPVTEGVLTATGTAIHQSGKIFIAESVLTDERNRKIGLGKGSFMRSDKKLIEIPGYEEKKSFG